MENFSLQDKIWELEIILEITEANLNRSGNENVNLTSELSAERERVGDIASQVSEITSTVGDLEKLSKTDTELLQKYSKVFFLNEHYVPDKLEEISLEYLYDEGTPKQIHANVASHMEDLLEDAAAKGVTLWIVSAYRSFGTQSSLKASYKVVYGSGANAFSADQGYSEHQLGTTIDFTTTGLGGGLQGFGESQAYQWLFDNAHRHGFVLSYPEGNSYYQFEPWHWRYVGTDLARNLNSRGKNFYNITQREIDEYLINIFD